jgi:hypothetical protein
MRIKFGRHPADDSLVSPVTTSMQIRTSYSQAGSESAAIRELTNALGSIRPQLLLVYMTQSYAAPLVLNGLRAHYPDSLIHGGTSCRAVMTESGYHDVDRRAVAVFAISDPGGGFGVGAADIGDDPTAAAMAATEAALDSAARAGEMPDLVWLSAAPGHEEQLLAGIEAVLGPNVLIVGGSSADDEVSGDWRQFAGTGVYSGAVTVSVLFLTTRVSSGFRGGYVPTGISGRVTAARGRTVYAIDGENAVAVYQRWSGLVLPRRNGEDSSVLAQTTLTPLGRAVAGPGQLMNYRLSHPESITVDGGLRFFTEIAEGEELVLMRGSVDSLVTRAGRVARFAADSLESTPDAVAGGLVIFCAGCMLAADREMHRVPSVVREVIGPAPFLGAFTYGEQGCIRPGQTHHGNLMVAVVLFEKANA